MGTDIGPSHDTVNPRDTLHDLHVPTASEVPFEYEYEYQAQVRPYLSTAFWF